MMYVINLQTEKFKGLIGPFITHGRAEVWGNKYIADGEWNVVPLIGSVAAVETL